MPAREPSTTASTTRTLRPRSTRSSETMLRLLMRLHRVLVWAATSLSHALLTDVRGDGLSVQKTGHPDLFRRYLSVDHESSGASFCLLRITVLCGR